MIALISVVVPLTIYTAPATKLALVATHLVAGTVFVAAMQHASRGQRARWGCR
jgi:uncharacterized membrane protein